MRELETIDDLLDALQETLQLPSDNQVAKKIGIGQSTVSAWRSGRATPTEAHAMTIAKVLEVSPVTVLCISAAERSDNKRLRKLWQEVAKQVAHLGPLMVAGIVVGSAACEPPPKLGADQWLL